MIRNSKSVDFGGVLQTGLTPMQIRAYTQAITHRPNSGRIVATYRTTTDCSIHHWGQQVVPPHLRVRSRRQHRARTQLRFAKTRDKSATARSEEHTSELQS